MAIADYSGWPDDKVPAWVKDAREQRRERDRRWRFYNVKGPDGLTEHERRLKNGLQQGITRQARQTES